MTIPAALLLGNFVDTGPNREVLARTISEVASSGLKTGQRVEEVEIVNVDGMSERTAGAALAKKPTKLEKTNGRGGGGNVATSMLQLSAEGSAVDHGSGDGLDKKRKQRDRSDDRDEKGDRESMVTPAQPSEMANARQDDRSDKKRKHRKKKTDENESLAFGRRSLQTGPTVVSYNLVLDELCGDIPCADLATTTTLYDEVTTNINGTIETGEFTDQLQTNAEECGAECEGLSEATVEQGGFDEEEVVIETDAPTLRPSESPSLSGTPTFEGSAPPSVSSRPTANKSTESPVSTPSKSPTREPTSAPSESPSLSGAPTFEGSAPPSVSSQPSTNKPSASPVSSPSKSPTREPTSAPSANPSLSGTPTFEGSAPPSGSSQPSTNKPTESPVSSPTKSPTHEPTSEPSANPTISNGPSFEGSVPPSVSSQPSTNKPTESPVSPTKRPSSEPTSVPSESPTISNGPSFEGSAPPSVSQQPSQQVTTESPVSSEPTSVPSASPTISNGPSFEGSAPPSLSSSPSGIPTLTKNPSSEPTTGINGVASVIGPETSFEADGCIYAGPQMGNAYIRDGVATDFNCPVDPDPSSSRPPQLVFTQDFESLVLGIRVYANTESYDVIAFSADPVSYTIEGRSGEAFDWELIAFGEFDDTWVLGGFRFPPPARNVFNEAINSSFQEGDPSKSFGYANFANTVLYKDYRVTFPSARFTRLTGEDYARIAISELELPGRVTLEPVPTSEPTLSPGPTASLLPTPEVLDGTASVIDPATKLQTIGCVDAGPTQGDAFLRDGVISDFTCPLDVFNETFPPQLILTQEYDSRVLGIRVYANSETLTSASLEADPVSYRIEGRLDENSEWEIVSEGEFDQAWVGGGVTGPPPPRNTASEEINSSFELGDPSKSFGYASFDNDAVYRDYRVTFPLTRFDEESTPEEYGRFAISELELPGVFIAQTLPTPQPVPIETTSPVRWLTSKLVLFLIENSQQALSREDRIPSNPEPLLVSNNFLGPVRDSN